MQFLRALYIVTLSCVGFAPAVVGQTVSSGTAGFSKPHNKIFIKSAVLTTGSGAPVQLLNVYAEMPPKQPNTPPTLIRSGIVFLTSESLSQVVNSKMKDGKIKDLKIVTEAGQKAKISGKVDKAGVPVPISIEGPVTLTNDGKLRLGVKSEKAGGIPIKGIADALHIDTTKSLEGSHSAMFKFEKDALIVDVTTLLGSARGTVIGVATSERGLTLHFGQARRGKVRPAAPRERASIPRVRASLTK